MKSGPAPADLIAPTLTVWATARCAPRTHASATTRNFFNRPPSPLSGASAHYVVLHGKSQEVRTPFAAMQLVLIGQVLPARIDIGENAAEAMIGVETRRAGHLEKPHRERAAALR